MKKAKDEMRSEYKRSDFTKLERGKFYAEAAKGTAVALLEPAIRMLDEAGFPEAAILASVRKTHRVLLVEENKPFCGVGAQLAYLIQEEAFDDLDAPIKRVSAIDAPAIYSAPLEKEQLPHPQRITKAVLDML